MKLFFNKKSNQLFWTIPKNIWVGNPAGISVGEKDPVGRSVLVIFKVLPFLPLPHTTCLCPRLCCSISQHAAVRGQNLWHCDDDVHTQYENESGVCWCSHQWVVLAPPSLQRVEKGCPTHDLQYPTPVPGLLSRSSH